MFGPFGAQEIFLILVLALIVFGPRRLPDIGKSMGRMLAEFRKASNEFKRTLEDEVESEKVREATIASPSTPASDSSTPASDTAGTPPTPSPYSDGETAVSTADQPVTDQPTPTADAVAADGHEAAPVTTEGEPGTIRREDSRPIEPR